MHNQRSCNTAPAPPSGDPETAVLALLLGEQPRSLWSIDEIERELGDALAARDALQRLEATGLVHRLGEFAFASRAAARFDALAPSGLGPRPP
jgi:hypothetical protein